jgi:hypothetical protein
MLLEVDGDGANWNRSSVELEGAGREMVEVVCWW